MKSKFLIFFISLLWRNIAFATEVKPYLSLYDQAVYPTDFSHFSYVNPDAPKGGRMVMPTYGTFDNFNPFIFKGISDGGYTVSLTLDTLGVTSLDDISTVYPLLAKAFEYPEDKSYVGFILDERARFHNGQPVLADDIIFSYKSLVEKGQPFYKVYYADVDRVEKINDYHVRFHFKKGSQNRELPLILAQMSIYSAEDWKYRDFAEPSLTPPQGSGPYVLDKFDVNKFIQFKRNPDYWAKDLPTRKGMFNFDELRYDYYQDTTVTLQALLAGNVDAREEYIAKIWATGYNNDVVKSGKVLKKDIEHNNAAPLQNFAYNLRRDKFKDKRVRQAIAMAFNFDWANENLFYGQYARITSYFPNTGMEAKGLPEGRELEILEQYKNQLDESVFTQEPSLPQHPTPQATRENLKQAVNLLKEAGYDFVKGKMTNLKTGEPLEFEVLGNSANGSSFTRVMLPFIANLKKIGIKLKFRNIEPSVFKNRLDNFDFDMAIAGFNVSRMPGNEQMEMWGSQSADVKGSYNILGLKNPVVDNLIKGVINAQTKEDYEAYVRALDRVLLNGWYLIPHWYSPTQRVAYWDKFEQPQTEIKTGFLPQTWWMKEGK
ncbi:MAG: ABC transporter substrate-binding protein [Alphaproteobacteria bacterium]|nr:ABC transporter substrate-binding protein [Alphaproteobacteria bacterium]